MKQLVILSFFFSCNLIDYSQRTDAFELWYWRRLLRAPWTARRSNLSILKGISPEHSLEGLMLKLRFQSFGQLVERLDSLGKDPDAGKDWGQEEKGATEDEMVGWHHWLNGQEFEQTPGNSEGQGSPACCSPWVAKGQTWLSDWTTTKCTQKQGHTHIHWLNVHSHRLTLTETQSYRWCAYTQPIHRHVDTLKQKSDYIVTLTQTYSHSPSTHSLTHTKINSHKFSLDHTSLVAQTVKHLSTMWETRVRSLGREDPLEKEMAIHSSTIVWKIPWTEEPGRLQSMQSQRVGHD